jgi:hypothetical protein
MSITSGYTLEPFDAVSPYFHEVVRIYLEAFGGEESAIRALCQRAARLSRLHCPDWRACGRDGLWRAVAVGDSGGMTASRRRSA